MKTITDIITEATLIFGTTQNAVRGRWRAKRTVRARFAVSWAARAVTDKSYPQIGRTLGGRDHSTIIAQVRRAEALRAIDPAFRAASDLLLQRVAA